MLRVEYLDVFYGDLRALSGVGFEVREGETVSIVGSNGAGKSTTLKTISGLLRPRNGRILFRGEEIQKASSSRIVEMGLCHVPEGRQIFPSLTVEENLEMGAQFPEVKKLRPRTMKRVYDYFPRLAERRGQKAGTLSGGEQQMLAIGRALMSKPEMLLLDEPSLGIAPILVKAIFKQIKEIARSGVTVLLVEQNAKAALKLADRGYVLDVGRIVLSGTAQELLSSEKVQEAYLGKKH